MRSWCRVLGLNVAERDGEWKREGRRRSMVPGPNGNVFLSRAGFCVRTPDSILTRRLLKLAIGGAWALGNEPIKNGSEDSQAAERAWVKLQFDCGFCQPGKPKHTKVGYKVLVLKLLSETAHTPLSYLLSICKCQLRSTKRYFDTTATALIVRL